MKPLSSQVVFLAAAGVLVAGGTYASQFYTSPPKYTGPNTQQILATAQRLQGELPKAPDAEAVAAEARAAAVAAALKRRVLVDPEPKPLRRNHRVEEVTAPPNRAPVRPSVATPQAIAPAAAPGANLALTGIGGSGSNREAMLFNLSDKRRDSGKAGDSVFGFTIASIREDSVDMTQGSTQVTLRLGEKSAAINAALAAPVAGVGGANTVVSNPTVAAPTANNPGGPGGRGGDWRARMAASVNQANLGGGGGDRGRGNRGAGGGRNNNNQRRASTTQSGARRYSDGPSSSSRYSTVSSGGSNRNGGFGGMRSGGGGGFGGRGRGGQGDQTVLEPTSNPQEARRTGAPLIGDVEAMLEPEAFSNPQTERRTGGTSGQAFGESSYGNRGGNNRGGGFGGGGFGNTGRSTGGRTGGTRTGNTRG